MTREEKLKNMQLLIGKGSKISHKAVADHLWYTVQHIWEVVNWKTYFSDDKYMEIIKACNEIVRNQMAILWIKK